MKSDSFKKFHAINHLFTPQKTLVQGTITLVNKSRDVLGRSLPVITSGGLKDVLGRSLPVAVLTDCQCRRAGGTFSDVIIIVKYLLNVFMFLFCLHVYAGRFYVG